MANIAVRSQSKRRFRKTLTTLDRDVSALRHAM